MGERLVTDGAKVDGGWRRGIVRGVHGRIRKDGVSLRGFVYVTEV